MAAWQRSKSGRDRRIEYGRAVWRYRETGTGGVARGGLNESNDVPGLGESARHRRHRIRRRVREAVLLIMAVILSAIILLGVYFAVSAAVVAKEVKTGGRERVFAERRESH